MAKAMQNRCGWQKTDLSEVVAYVSNICGVALNGEKLDILPLLKSKLDSLLPESKTLGQKFGKKQIVDWAKWTRKFASKENATLSRNLQSVSAADLWVGKIGPSLTKDQTNKIITQPCNRGLGQANNCFENRDRSSFRLARRYECGFVPSLSVGPRHTGSNKLSLHGNYNAVRVKLHCHHECYAG